MLYQADFTPMGAGVLKRVDALKHVGLRANHNPNTAVPSNMAARTGSGNQPLVVPVGTNPKPHNIVPFRNSKGSITQGDSNRVDLPCGMNLLEPETWMVGVISEE